MEKIQKFQTDFWHEQHSFECLNPSMFFGTRKKFHYSDIDLARVKVAQLCQTPWDPKDYTVPGILQARKLEWVAIPFSTGSSQPRDWTQVSHTAGRFFTSWCIILAKITTVQLSCVWLSGVWLFATPRMLGLQTSYATVRSMTGFPVHHQFLELA